MKTSTEAPICTAGIHGKKIRQLEYFALMFSYPPPPEGVSVIPANATELRAPL
jgi:hypothetical protein